MLSIYKASAGSGKTYTLTKRYIIQLLGYQDDTEARRWHLSRQTDRHRSILAITFTNLATEEMKRRILHELAVLGGMEPGWTEPSPYLEELTKLFGCTEKELSDASGKALKSILLDYGRFNVSTIDAFFQTVLRTFAREAELMGNYELDMEKESGIQEGLERLISEVSESGAYGTKKPDRQLQQWFGRFLENYLLEGKSFNVFSRRDNVFKSIVKFVSKVTNQIYYERLDEISSFISDRDNLNRFKEALVRNVTELKEAVVDQFRHLNLLVESSGWEDKYNKHFKDFLGKFVEGWPSNLRPTQTPDKVKDDPTNAFVKKGKDLLLKGEEPFPASLETIGEAFKLYANNKSRIVYYDKLLENIYTIGLMSTVMNYIKDYRSESSTFLIEETNSVLHRIIGHDDAPFIYERIGMQLKHFLIDEFQDTSHQQWKNLQPLVENSLSEDNDNLIIGDEKQAIYRFRGSDPNLLATLHQTLTGRTEIEGADSEGNTNWRSAPVVVDFNNRHFRALVNTLGEGFDSYSNVCQQTAKKNRDLPGYVVLNKITAKQDKEGEGFAYTLGEMNRQLGSGGYYARDIAVLVLTNNIAAKFIDYFESHAGEYENLQNVSLISDDSLYVNSSTAVKMVVSALNYHLATGGKNNKDGESKTLRGRRFSYALEYYLSETHNDSPLAMRKALAVMNKEEAEESLDVKINAISSVTLQGLVGRLIHDVVPESLRREQAVYLTAFQDLVTDYCNTKQPDVKSFLDWWEGMSGKAIVSGTPDINSIRVMTIHKSKGLEFKCVHIPTTVGASSHKPSPIWFEVNELEDLRLRPECLPHYFPLTPDETLLNTPLDKQYREWKKEGVVDELNKLYVGYTRAINELIVNVVESAASKGSSAASKKDFKKLASEGFNSLDVEAKYEGEFCRKILGRPTKAVSQSGGHTGVLDADVTVEMPPYGALSKRDLWQLTRLDESAAVGRTEALRQVMLHVDKASSLEKTLRRRDLPPLGDDDVALLRRRLSEHPELFAPEARILNRHVLTDGRGNTKACDRIVLYPEGNAFIVNYMLPYDDLSEEKQMERLNVRRRLLQSTRSGQVRAFLWDLETGVMKECCDRKKG